MKEIEEILKTVNEENNDKVDWTQAWSGKYPVLGKYQNEVDISYYAKNISMLLEKLMSDYGYNRQDAMLVLKDILYHEYKKTHNE